MTEEVQKGLERLGVKSFRPGQEKIVNAILAGKDTLCIMPTGSGKSLCYQLPAILMPGITIVVSPLIALMHDQVLTLCKKGVPAAYLNSTLTPQQMGTAMRRAYAGRYKIIYVAPERLMTYDFLSFASVQDISLLVVDEAHCVSQWGHAFRQAYQAIPQFVANLKHRPVITAFTATATKAIRNEITEMIGLNDPELTVAGFDRPNLYFNVLQINPTKKEEWLSRYAEEKKDQCGIVYCRSRKTAEAVAEQLKKDGIAADYYHAGLEPEEKHDVLERFLSGEITVLASTTAFGMGIDKPDVRYVVHYDMPLSVEDYYQQAGRAGRDGLPSECILLHTLKDREKSMGLINESIKDAPFTNRASLLLRETSRLDKMERYANFKGCLRAELLRYFGEKPEYATCGNCGNCTKKSTGKTPALDAVAGLRRWAVFATGNSPCYYDLYEEAVPGTMAFALVYTKEEAEAICEQLLSGEIQVNLTEMDPVPAEVYGDNGHGDSGRYVLVDKKTGIVYKNEQGFGYRSLKAARSVLERSLRNSKKT